MDYDSLILKTLIKFTSVLNGYRVYDVRTNKHKITH